jgi:hypothetical protein
MFEIEYGVGDETLRDKGLRDSNKSINITGKIK